MIKWIINKLIGTPSERKVKELRELIDKVNSLEPETEKLSDEELKSKREEFIGRYKEDESLKELMPEAFAVAREVCKRKVDMRHFDVQLIGGAVLFEGNIAEMATGEGKTLVAVLPVYLQSLSESSTHVVTVNDYLARRDAEWMTPAYRALGLTVGFIQSDMEPEERKVSYARDVIYITNNEIGFDYLRDNMAISPEHQVQGKLEYAILDEVDSVLIDEARTPLIISGPSGKSSKKYYTVDKIIPQLDIKYLTEKEEVKEKYKFEEEGLEGDYRDALEKDHDAIVDEKSKNTHLTERGMYKCEELLGVKLFDDITGEWVHHINQALRAHYLFKEDIDYVKKKGEIIIVDEFTGRLMPGRRWSDGLHQAIESKENLTIKRENQTLATVTFQNFFNLYDKLSGMTGTAITEQSEFHKIYDLSVLEIPPNRELNRESYPDAIYRTPREKYNAIIEKIKEMQDKGRPVLVGSRSIEVSEKIANMLKNRGLKHSVLNAKYHQKEAEIVAQAGRKGAVTISTNMAGRGTDIILGGNPEFLAKREMERENIPHADIIIALEKTEPKNEDEKELKEKFTKLHDKFKKDTDVEHKEVVEAGGLYVIGSERHESRRIDNQLRGRAGRQGDPGASKFFVSLEDDLMRLFGSDKIITVMDKLGGLEEGENIEHALISRAISRAQKRVEGMNFDIRKQLLDYDNVMDKQRKSIYTHRSRILKGDGVSDEIEGFIEDYVDMVLEENIPKKQHPEEWDTAAIESELVNAIGFNTSIIPVKYYHSGQEGLRGFLEENILGQYKKRKEEFGEGEFKNMEKMILIQIIDSRWKDHLYALDSIKESVSFSGYAQKDPLVEYKRASFEAFTRLMDTIKREVITYIFRATGEILNSRIKESFGKAQRPEVNLPVKEPASGPQGAPRDDANMPGKNKIKRRTVDKEVGRNDPCPCGSGKKHKHCCGR
ncbi:MAG: preprotein translocase subunit SecA [Elusimicrobia bacterium]|jgi:preprotein translocase subunit SecA|nr:preprotein translocase subunit SecA [Elusimicrobiota bacterium]